MKKSDEQTAFGRLWRRATLWRSACYATLITGGLAFLYPTQTLVNVFPFLRNFPGIQLSDAPRLRNAIDRSPSAATTNSAPSLRLAASNILSSYVGNFEFGGRLMPLPEGVWHPVLRGETGAQGDLIAETLIRTDRGIVTGIVFARRIATPVARALVAPLADACHDDRNFINRVVVDAKNGELACWRVYPAHIGVEGETSADALAQATFERVRSLNFPLPSMFVETSWIRITPHPSGDFTATVVDVLFSPNVAGSIRLLAPLDGWNNTSLAQHPAALTFMRRTSQWMEAWSRTMYRTVTNRPSFGSRDLPPDPQSP